MPNFCQAEDKRTLQFNLCWNKRLFLIYFFLFYKLEATMGLSKAVGFNIISSVQVKSFKFNPTFTVLGVPIPVL